MPFAVVGGIAAAAGVYSSIEGGQAAGATAAAANNARNQSNTIFNEQQGFATQLQQLFANPSSVSNLPFFNFQEQQGEQAVSRQMGASGYSGSGNEAIALQQYGSGYAAQTFDQYAQLLGSFSGLNQNPMQGQAIAGQNSNMAFNQYGQLAGAAGSLYQQFGGTSFGNGGWGSPGYGGGPGGPNGAGGINPASIVPPGTPGWSGNGPW